MMDHVIHGRSRSTKVEAAHPEHLPALAHRGVSSGETHSMMSTCPNEKLHKTRAIPTLSQMIKVTDQSHRASCVAAHYISSFSNTHYRDIQLIILLSFVLTF